MTGQVFDGADLDELQLIRKFPDKCCAAQVSRNGESKPCDKVAVAVAKGWDEYEDGNIWWPVCAHHARGRRMVPLEELIRMMRGEPSRVPS